MMGTMCKGARLAGGNLKQGCSRKPVDWQSFLLALAWLAIGGVIAAPVHGQNTVPIPEPDITYFGTAPAGSQISISHPAGLLDSASASAANPYVLTVKLVQPVVTPTP